MRLTPVLAALSLLGGCAQYPAKDNALQSEYYRAPRGMEQSAAYRSELLLRALALVGVQYKFGGNSPATGFDCSGLVQYLFGEVLGLPLPRSAQEMSKVGDEVGADELHPGDLVFFNTLRQPFSHVGIYLGERRFIHAPTSGGRVEIVNMTHRYWQRRYNGARRIAL